MLSTLIVGGTGLTGAHTALHLRERGHSVTLMSRTAPSLPALTGFDHILGDYLVDQDLSRDLLGSFDFMVFAAGADIRQFPRGEDEEAFYTRVNSEGIPHFFRRARDAGVKSAVYIGSFYPQIAPEVVETSIYVRSRHLADEGVRALNCDAFRVCSLNAPFILGYLEGMSLPHLSVLVQYAQGTLEGVPPVAPAGGVNHITSQSMAQAIEGALARGKGGHAYLVGDENLSWKDYLELYFLEAGRPTDLPVSRDEHPLFPDIILYGGRNAILHFEPENGELGYSRNQVRSVIALLVQGYAE